MRRRVHSAARWSAVKRAGVLALMLAVAPAAADVAPAGWKLEPGLSHELTRKAQRGTYFGAVPTTSVAVEAFLAPKGGSLFVTRAEAAVTATQRDAAASHAVFELVDGARRQGAAQIEASGQRADAAGKQLEATITWRDPAGVRQVARTIVAGDETRVVASIGECVLPSEAAAGVEQACTAALAKLDPGIAAGQRVMLAIVDAPAETDLPPIPTAPTTAPTAPNPQAAPARMTEQPRLGEGGRTPMAPMTISPARREIDRRPLYLGGGIIVLAALFWWNRRRRDRFDREDGPTAATTDSESTSGDDDADDLQAAAKGAAPKDET